MQFGLTPEGLARLTEAEKDASKVENLIPVAIEGMRQVIAADLAAAI